jgi:hypothetical protein
MNKEIIHQAAQAHAEKSLYNHWTLKESNVYTWAYCFTATESIANWLKNILKPEYFGIKNNSKPAAKPLIKKESKTWFSVNCWPLKRK